VIETILGSRTRVGILRALLSEEGHEYRLLELTRAVGTSVSSVQSELARLESIDLVRSRKSDGARLIIANVAHPFVAGIRELLAADAVASAPSLTDAATLARLNPRIRGVADRLVQAASRHGVLRLALVGSATQSDPAVTPRDLDVLVRLDPSPAGYAERYFALRAELEEIMGMPVDIIEEDALTNPYLAGEFARTQVVLYEAA
jgi:predicted nucleotidyltransferase